MKIVVAGVGHSEVFERACARGLSELGHDVTGVYWAPLIRRTLGIGTRDYWSFGTRLQAKLNDGPVVRRYNRQLLADCVRIQPDVVLVYRGTMVLPKTLAAIKKKTSALLLSFNDDDPYSPGAHWLEWRHFRAGVPHYDFNFVHRHRNLHDYAAHGGRNVHLLRGSYQPWRNFPLELTEEELERCGNDVVFAGHWERDGREKTLEKLAATGVDLRIYGPEWRTPFAESEILRRLPEPIYLDKDYNAVINASKIILNFMSVLNRDTYTIRSFEVPASGGFLLSQYSDDLASLYTEGKEIAFFRSDDDLIEKVRYYLEHDDERRAIARAARERVVRDKHDVVSRMQQVLDIVAPALPGKAAAR